MDGQGIKMQKLGSTKPVKTEPKAGTRGLNNVE
jgi:hypothetical protein